MGGKFCFPDIDIEPDVPKCRFILKNSSLECWLSFRLFFVADIKLIYGINFVAPLTAIIQNELF